MFSAGLLPNSVNCLTDGMIDRVRAVWFPTAPVAPSMMTLFGFGVGSFSLKSAEPKGDFSVNALHFYFPVFTTYMLHLGFLLIIIGC